jgi:signal peptidase I
VPNPFIAVSLTQHWFWVNNFMPGTLVTFYIYDNKGDENTIFEFSRNTDDFGNVNIEGWEHLWNPEPGDYVVATDGSNTKDLELEYITLDVFDPENDRVSGYALPGREVGVGVGNETGEQWMSVYTNDSTGEWVADFTLEGFEFDITEDSWAGGNVNDEDGDVTAAHNSGPSEPPAWFTVFPEQDAVEAWNWPLGALVHMAIDDPSTEATPDYEQDETITFTPWGSWQLWAWFDFAGVYDVKPGDIVTLSYGDTVRTHVVRNLAITKANHEDDIVKGTADAGAEIHVWPHATGQEQLAKTNPQGKWNVDFTGIYDLKPRDGGRAEIRDEMGNATAIDWYIPEPRFTIYPDAQWFDGNDWPDGATVRITVKDKPKCTFTQESWGRFFNGNFPDGCIVTAGDRVTFTDGTIIRKHTVRNLAITKIDKEANTVMGIADTGAVVHAWVWNSDGSTLDGSNLYVTAVDGMWQADFGALGINLEIGMGIQAEIQDENGNTTSVDLNVPNTRIVASITEDWFYLADFIPGATLDLSIYEIKDGSLIWSNDEMTADVNGFAWIDSEGWNLQPGNYLVASDGNTAKDLVVEGFTFDTFNLANGQLSGTAPSGRNVWVGIGFQDQDAWTMNVTADSGTWLADFGQPVPSDYWWVAAQIFDADGDASELRPASQIIFLRPSCGSTYTVQAGSPLEIRYGSWIAIGEALAIQNAEHLTVELVLNGETVTGVQQPVVPRSEIPCGMPLENAYGVFYVTYVDPLSPGTYIAEVTWILDIAVTDGYDADGDGEPEWYGPGEIFTHEFTIIVP